MNLELDRLLGLQAWEEALPVCEQLAHHWGDKAARMRLPFLYRSVRQLTKALDAQRWVIHEEGESPQGLAHLSYLLFASGEIDAGLEEARRAAERFPGHAEAVSNYLFTLNYDPRQTRQGLFEAHVRWGGRRQVACDSGHSPRNLDPGRPLRVGYLSSDFWRHSVSFAFEPFLRGRDPTQTVALGYGLVENPDDVTDYFARAFDGYRSVRELTDEALAERMRADEIDLLVVIGGYIGENRLSLCAHGPAPIIVEYGAPCTLGLSTVDYRLTDVVLDPVGTEAFYRERLARLPEGLTCFRPLDGLPEPGELPARGGQGVTFGSFNASPKINGVTIGLWARVLRSIPSSRLMLKFAGGDDPGIRSLFMDRFARQGVRPDRISLNGWMPQSDHFALYRQVDVALDTFPYNGGITTLESLWMGVPVLSLWGETAVSRVGLDLLGRLGMDFMACGRPEDFVNKAACLANNLDALEKTRLGLRTRMRKGPLCDAHRFGRQLEMLYRQMWHAYLANQASLHPGHRHRAQGAQD